MKWKITCYRYDWKLVMLFKDLDYPSLSKLRANMLTLRRCAYPFLNRDTVLLTRTLAFLTFLHRIRGKVLTDHDTSGIVLFGLTNQQLNSSHSDVKLHKLKVLGLKLFYQCYQEVRNFLTKHICSRCNPKSLQFDLLYCRWAILVFRGKFQE
jgi:hypothetical protein